MLELVHDLLGFADCVQCEERSNDLFGLATGHNKTQVCHTYVAKGDVPILISNPSNAMVAQISCHVDP
jgi:hypothetical protein